MKLKDIIREQNKEYNERIRFKNMIKENIKNRIKEIRLKK